MKQLTTCPVCGSRVGKPFLIRRRVPAHQNLLPTTRQEARRVPRGDVSLVICGRCGFIHNATFDARKLRYDDAYNNSQSCSAAFRKHEERCLRRVAGGIRLRGCRVIEVGCGKGQFLARLARADARAIGYDPSYEGPSKRLGGRLRFVKRNFSASGIVGTADIVVCRHVVEHTPDPVGLLREMRRVFRPAKACRLFIETPDVEWILQNRVFWDVFYEHCSYFSPATLVTAVRNAGFTVRAIRRVFGRQYLWLEAIPDRDQTETEDRPTGEDLRISRSFAAHFAKEEARLARAWRTRLAAWAGRGRVAVWGAGAKGVTFLNLVDPAAIHVACAVDINPDKQGCFIPGTGHPVVDAKAIASLGVRTVVLMNPNYRRECLRTLAHIRPKVRLIGQDDL